MRIYLITATLAAGLSTSSFAQGVISIGAAADKIQYTTYGSTLTSVPTGSPASIPGLGILNIAVYSASSGTVLATSGSSIFGGIPDFSQNGWHIQTSPILHNIAPQPGGFGATAVTLDAASGAPNAVEQIEVVGWTGNFSSFQAAIAGGTGLIAWMGESIIPGGSGFNISFTTGDGVFTTPGLTTGANGFNGLVFAAPEPGTLLLGGLGAAVLFFFRRHK